MKFVRAALSAFCMFFAGLFPLLAIAADEPFLAPLKDTYAAIAGGNNPAFFSKKLMALNNAALENAEIVQEPLPGLDFVYAINGQDYEDGLVDSVKYEVLSQSADKAEVKVTFNNYGKEALGYSVVLEDGNWAIDEVKCMTSGCEWVYSELLKEAAAYKP